MTEDASAGVFYTSLGNWWEGVEPGVVVGDPNCSGPASRPRTVIFYFKFSLLKIVGHPNSYLSRRSGRNQMTIPRGTEVAIRIQLDLPGRVIVGQIISKHSER